MPSRQLPNPGECSTKWESMFPVLVLRLRSRTLRSRTFLHRCQHPSHADKNTSRKGKSPYLSRPPESPAFKFGARPLANPSPANNNKPRMRVALSASSIQQPAGTMDQELEIAVGDVQYLLIPNQEVVPISPQSSPGIQDPHTNCRRISLVVSVSRERIPP